ncbi:CBS domain-containing protein [Actinomadura barringtoniae]|uniref:CBS domain-containing protein n=1 Tax=Actinomadura barringtoniae TaxID=1427535 RepID=A0A939PLK3_9ACTN|nr:CBS domain-containing protein [Actinomadura barringtoniae]MBO2455187.1 CBS domain-containing protein [Actinomadura barringtoniae]
MLVQEAMSTAVVTVARSASVRQAIRILNDNQITAAPVTDETGHLVGIVSEMDLLRGEFEADPRAFARHVAAPADPPPRRVEDAMTTNVFTVRPNSDVAELAEVMMSTGYKSVPVMDGPVIAGMISRRDLIAILARSDARIRDDVLALLRDYLRPGFRWEVTVADGVVELSGDGDERVQKLADDLVRTVPGATRVVIFDRTRPEHPS